MDRRRGVAGDSRASDRAAVVDALDDAIDWDPAGVRGELRRGQGQLSRSRQGVRHRRNLSQRRGVLRGAPKSVRRDAPSHVGAHAGASSKGVRDELRRGQGQLSRFVEAMPVGDGVCDERGVFHGAGRSVRSDPIANEGAYEGEPFESMPKAEAVVIVDSIIFTFVEMLTSYEHKM